ncbi:MAG: hypothetical protein JO296_02775 [Pseudonocardiales bacterium]|nr:hypothetical protein [Pseudonocardiales bacterium]MBV9649048.1 hypothetical protein [Pseudonocardiales bacterium]
MECGDRLTNFHSDAGCDLRCNYLSFVFRNVSEAADTRVIIGNDHPGIAYKLPDALIRHSISWLGVPALRPACAIDSSYDAAARRAAHEGSPLPEP